MTVNSQTIDRAYKEIKIKTIQDRQNAQGRGEKINDNVPAPEALGSLNKLLLKQKEDNDKLIS